MPVTADGNERLKISDHLNNLAAGDTITMKVLRAGEITELTTLRR
jgi:hypothetical protein